MFCFCKIRMQKNDEMMSTVDAVFRNAKSQSWIPLGDFIYEQMIPQAWQNWNQRDFSAKFDSLCVCWLLHVFIDPSQFENEPKKKIWKQISYLIDTTKMLLNAPNGSISIYIVYFQRMYFPFISFLFKCKQLIFHIFFIHLKNTKKKSKAYKNKVWIILMKTV